MIFLRSLKNDSDLSVLYLIMLVIPFIYLSDLFHLLIDCPFRIRRRVVFLVQFVSRAERYSFVRFVS